MTLLLNYLAIGAVLTLLLRISSDFANRDTEAGNRTVALWLLWFPAYAFGLLIILLLLAWWACETISDRIHRR